MTLPSLNDKAAKFRALLDELMTRLADQPASSQEAAAAELDRVSAILERSIHGRAEGEERRSPDRLRSDELQAILDAIPTPIFIARNATGENVTGNLASYRMLRVTPGANLSRVPTGGYPATIRSELHAGTEIPPEEAPIMVALRTGKPVEEYEAQILFEDGQEVVLLGSANPLFDPSGKVTGAVSVYVDITARMQAERALRLIAERDAYRITLADALRRLTDPEVIKTTAVEILGKKLAASRVFYASISADGKEVILEPGYAAGVAALIGRFLFADFSRDLQKDHPNGRPYVINDIPNDPGLTAEQKAAYLGVNVQAHVDVPLLINGKFVALLSAEQSTPRQWKEEEIALIVETAERTSASVERARAEKALREGEARFRQSIESLMESFILYSAVRDTRKDGRLGKIRDMQIDYANEAAHKINGKVRGEFEGHTLLEALPEEIGKPLFDLYMRVISNGQPLMERVRLGETEADSRVYDVHAVKLGDGLVATRLDVTEQVEMERERQNSITQMMIHNRLAEQSENERITYARELHDGPIQTLASIAYDLQYIKETFPQAALEVELERVGSSVRSAVQELRQVISELRPPSTISFGLSRAIEMHAEELQDRNPWIKWQFDLQAEERELPETVILALYRIYQEGVSNIIRHSAATRAKVRFQFRKDSFILDIRDNGKGLLEAFNSEKLTRTGHFGLVGMSERAEAVNGVFQLTSTPGKGTHIRVTVPCPG